ncbi:hypothetical protein Poly24_10560 [Rosistilla carotiformis]|uniref:Uncharacterized protein n=1 Tax=Rosistilla carotiformis TaxID=2528017 RepID=A0A518JPB4_9BACT|nr:hypothetical protein [Rosistilla carotiformis]QDV67361.1 hypothetical protein Poly24_10560 [Rosistilla carotiformis]
MDNSSLIDRFEAAWQQRDYGAIDSLLCDPTLAIDDAAELAMIDLEYRWRFPVPVGVETAIPNSPIVEDYCQRMPALPAGYRQVWELIGEEYRVRLQWATAPTIDDLLLRFDAYSREVLEKMIGRLQQEVPHLWLVIVRGETELSRTRFHRTLDVGRQSIGQPLPFAEIPVADYRKLIIAELDNVTVSRNQLRLSRSSVGVQLKNLSSQVVVRFGFRSRLLPRQCVESVVPVTLSIGDLELHITR